MKKCDICVDYEEYDFESHKLSMQHRFNFLLFEYNNFRKHKETNKNVTIVPYLYNNNKLIYNYDESKGEATVQCINENSKENKYEIRVKFKISNVGKKTVYIKIIILHPHQYFSLENNNTYELNPNEVCQPTVKFNLNCNVISSFDIPLAFIVQPKINPEEYYNVYRNIKIFISPKLYEENEDLLKNPFKEEIWVNESERKASLKQPKFSNDFPIPDTMKRIFYNALVKFQGIRYEEADLLKHIKATLEEGANKKTYADFFHYLLWLDEAYATLQLMKYNMSQVSIKVLRHDELELVVPGLAEKRPSVLVGDIINIRLHKSHIIYEGIVNTVTDKTVIIKYVDEELIELINQYPLVEIDVRFTLSRLLYDRMHRSLIDSKEFYNILFPKTPKKIIIPRDLRTDELRNKRIAENIQQFLAVKNIISCTSQNAPYIVFGPPGTGKTVTIVESIFQLLRLYPKKRILICAPSNAACDMLSRKLSEFCTKKQLLRIYTSTRDIKEVPLDLNEFSNIIGDEIYAIKGCNLSEYNIVVATLHLMGKFKDSHYGSSYQPDILFIDEAAQATEPECLIPISLMSSQSQIILAGDPMQLGSVISSKVAEKYGLGISLMERLMQKNDLYKKNDAEEVKYNQDYLTMLVVNYRSHKDIIHIPNDLFYNNSLTCMAHSDPISNVFISQLVCNNVSTTKIFNCATSVEFCGILSQEQRTGLSPSFYNEAEIGMVLKYITCLINISAFKVKPIEIGVISPYIRQVQKIKYLLNCKGLDDVEVGTTESFQGREKRIIIISTVRAQQSLLKYDKQYKLGFVSNERRFNVAITRSKAKVIVIGNPYCLEHDKNNWLKFIEFCTAKEAYFGVEFIPRTKELKEEVIKRFNLIKNKTK